MERGTKCPLIVSSYSSKSENRSFFDDFAISTTAWTWKIHLFLSGKDSFIMISIFETSSYDIAWSYSSLSFGSVIYITLPKRIEGFCVFRNGLISISDWVFGNVWSCSTLFIMKTTHKSDELKKRKKKGGGPQIGYLCIKGN